MRSIARPLAHEDAVLDTRPSRSARFRGAHHRRGAPQDRRAVVLVTACIPHDAGTILDQQGIAVRTGQHCAQPVMDRYCIPATIRASLGIYNTREDIDVLVLGLQKVREVFA